MNYDIDFWDKMLRQNSSTAEDISKRRWNFLIEHIKVNSVLDFGSGVGWFRAFRPEGVEVDTYDIGQFPQTGIRRTNYDVLCLWDVLEHLPNLKEIEPYLSIVKNIALTVPILPKDKSLNEWKHFKPREHLHYFNKETLKSVFLEYGFRLFVDAYSIECPPREDVMSFIFNREIK